MLQKAACCDIYIFSQHQHQKPPASLSLHPLPQGKLPAADDAGGSTKKRAYLSNVCVVPAARRQGVAQALVAAVERFVRGELCLVEFIWMSRERFFDLMKRAKEVVAAHRGQQ